jgi:predicted transcriptional regulator
MTASKRPAPIRDDLAAAQLGKELGRRLRHLRAQLSESQLDVSQRAKVGRAYLSRAERGKILPGYATLVKMNVPEQTLQSL